MNRCSSLQEMITMLEYGTKLHISIEFFNRELQYAFRIPHKRRIHSTPFCDEVKERRGLSRCLICKGKAMDKARRTAKPFCGLCVNGVFEYCYPVYLKDNLIGIVFIGNIINDEETFLKKSGLTADSPLLDTMQRNVDEEICLGIGQVVASYILLLSENLPELSNAKRINATIAAVRSYVDCYYYLNISLSEIAHMYHYNEKYLGTLFKKQVGMSFHDYLNKRRLSRAKQLLEKSTDSVLAVSLRVGFNNVTYFNRLFRETYGVTPSQLRANKE